MKKWLATFLLKRLGLGVWGVEIETQLPKEFIVTYHAFLRLKERFPGFDEKKLIKIVMKAWMSEETSEKMERKKARDPIKTREYRLFNGVIFIFSCQKYPYEKFIQKKLITAILPGQL